MTIEFFCPNEHQLSAPDTMAGKAGKCPKCGSKFLIPTLEELRAGQEELEAADTSAADSAAGRSAASKAESSSASSKKSAWQGTPPPPSSPPSSKKSATAPASVPAEAAASDQGRSAPPPPGHFVFLCPNNHKLNGPLSLKGKPGQCPHCGAKFRIPDDVEETAAEAGAEAEDEGAAPTGAGAESRPRPPQSSVPPADEVVEEGIIVDLEPEAEEVPSVEPISVWQLPPPPPGQGHRLAELFSWFWSQREQRSVVELTLKDGQSFVPKWFAPELSLEGYGAFAVQDEFGRFTITVLPWDSIVRMVVRNLEDVPPQFG